MMTSDKMVLKRFFIKKLPEDDTVSVLLLMTAASAASSLWAILNDSILFWKVALKRTDAEEIGVV